MRPPCTRTDFDLDPSEFNTQIGAFDQSTPKRSSGSAPSDFGVGLSSPLSSPNNKDDDDNDNLHNSTFDPNSNPNSTSTSKSNSAHDDKTDLLLILNLLSETCREREGETKTKTKTKDDEAAYKALGVALGVVERNGWVCVTGGKEGKDREEEEGKEGKDEEEETDGKDGKERKDEKERENGGKEGWYHEACRIYQNWVGSRSKLKMEAGGRDVRSKVSSSSTYLG